MIVYTMVKQKFHTQFAKKKYNRNSRRYAGQLLDLGAAQDFLDRKSGEFGAQCRKITDKITDICFQITGPHPYIGCEIHVTESLNEAEEAAVEKAGSRFLSEMAEEFNGQAFTKTKYGHAKMKISTGEWRGDGFSLIYRGAVPKEA